MPSTTRTNANNTRRSNIRFTKSVTKITHTRDKAKKIKTRTTNISITYKFDRCTLRRLNRIKS